MGRDKQAKLNVHDLAAAHRKLSQHKLCLHPEIDGNSCSTKIVRAHSIRRSADLTAIAQAGHVFQIKNDVQTLIRTKGKYQAKKVGINEASTFTGFCATHDASLFAPLERKAYDGSEEQNFLLFLRAWCLELYTKEGAKRTIANMRQADRGRSVTQQHSMQTFLDRYEYSIGLGLRDLRAYKEKFDVAWAAKDFSIVQSCIIEFAGKLPVVCSGATYPYYDVNGTELQQFTVDSPPAPLAITVLIEQEQSIAILSWFADSAEAPSKFAASVTDETSVSDALCRVLYSCIENLYANPQWWNSLTDGQRDELLSRMSDSATLGDASNPTYLASRGGSFCDVGVRRIRRV